MTKQAKQTKILSAIQARGWFTCDIYWNEAKELEAQGLIKLGTRYSTGGNLKTVWVGA